jgi:hypothetical protein
MDARFGWAGKNHLGDVHKREQRLKPRFYDEPVVRELIKLWELLNYSCGGQLNFTL